MKPNRKIVFFADPECAPCRRIAPDYKELAEEGYNVEFKMKGEEPDLFAYEKIYGAPTMKFYENDILYATAQGEMSKQVAIEVYNRDTSMPIADSDLTAYEQWYIVMDEQMFERFRVK
jgi:thiol-disulfide isomerase/thioredoxin